MSETKPNAVNVTDILAAQALAEMQKSGNRVKTAVLLASLAEFVNSGETTLQHFEVKYPTITVARLRQIIKSNTALTNRVWPIKTDEFGVCLVNVDKAKSLATQ